MKRIIVIGCGGSGKSTLARALGEKTGLPVVHLDQIWWSPGNWEHISPEDFDLRLAEEMRKDAWILDGNFSRTLPRRLELCDTVIYLDFNRFVCVFGWLKRLISNRGKARQDMAPGCVEKFDPAFIRWIWEFNRKRRPEIYALLSQAPHAKTVILKNRSQVKRFLEHI